jgi:hypothetical protein
MTDPAPLAAPLDESRARHLPGGPPHADEVLDLLISGQSTVRCLLARYRALCRQGAGSDARRGGLARRLCAELAVQLQIEDEVFYPALRAAMVDGWLIDVAEVEHECLRDLTARVVEMSPTDPLFDARVLVIGELLELHLAREAHELHPAARRSTAIDFHGIALQLVQRRDDLLAELADGHGLRFESEEADPVGEPPR